jgi:ABC-2 type transport system permease protein
MSMQSNTMAEAHSAVPDAANATLPRTRPFVWSLRRELWEHRSVRFAPLGVAGIVLFGFVMGLLRSPQKLWQYSNQPLEKQMMEHVLPYGIAAVALIATTVIVGVFYCLGALHNERRDRSILFWKSMPVSDLTALFAKACIPLVILPLVAFVTIVATQIILLLLSVAALLVTGHPPAPYLATLPLPQIMVEALYGLVTLSLWYWPVYGWLLFISSWARRVPFLWAVLPPLGLGLIEKLAFDSSHVFELLNGRLLGSFPEAFVYHERAKGGFPFPQMNPVGFFSSPGLWIGMVLGAGLFVAAVWMRRRREPV